MEEKPTIRKQIGKIIGEAIPEGKMREKVLQANMHGKFTERQILESLVILLEREDERERSNI